MGTPAHINKVHFEARAMIMMMMMIIIIIIITINFKMSSLHSKMLKAGYKLILPMFVWVQNMISYSEERTHGRLFGKTHKRDETERALLCTLHNKKLCDL